VKVNKLWLFYFLIGVPIINVFLSSCECVQDLTGIMHDLFCKDWMSLSNSF